MRLFLAIPVSPAVRAALLHTAAQMKRLGSGTFARPENLHLTLAFLGETERLAAARGALDRACEKAAPFSMAVGGLGRFGDLWWAGVEENARLEHLALEIQQTLREEGFAIERRPWKPHITLVRRWRGPDPDLCLPDTAMSVEWVSLLKSEAGKECALDDSNLTVVICDSVDYRSNSTKPCESAFYTFVIPKWVFISHSMHYSLSLV